MILVNYVDHRSLWLDVKILWMTVFKVLRREGPGAVAGGGPETRGQGFTESVCLWSVVNDCKGELRTLKLEL
jgi:hypothetical protein